MEKYNIETLKKENGIYNMEHTVTGYDVNKANMYVALIESSRNNHSPMPGDIVQFTNKYGDYYGNAHIEIVDEKVSICEQPYVPFIRPEKTGIRCNTSGGAWTSIPAGLKLIGKQQKRFKDWGHSGACGNGAIHFRAEVNVWEYVEPDPLHGDFSTKYWRKMYVSHSKNENYEYAGDGIAWKNKNEFDEFINKYKGVVFTGNWLNQIVVWCYREKTVLVKLEELEKMNLPETTILLNGIRPAKMEVDDENKIIIHYANW
ncbi:MAG: DUF4121 family protein [Dysgonamonadaceae bacterium]|jgi:hypothetical protein|nr:DUF4121 family protein [Dysgonamonadaceae bacterium]